MDAPTRYGIDVPEWKRSLTSREFKLEAVKLVVERGVSVAQAAKDLDVHENVQRKWVREAKADPRGGHRFELNHDFN